MKILIHATLCPEGEAEKRQNTTMFMHYYAAEWVKQGHEVLVVHHKVHFPRWMVRAGRIVGRMPGFSIIRDYLNGYGEDDDRSFERDGVPIVRMGLGKIIPRTLFSDRIIKQRARKVGEFLADRRFVPDIVLCDFINPGLFVALEMRTEITAPVCAVIHNTDEAYFHRPLTSKVALDAARRADALAFRSRHSADGFFQAFFTPESWFLMPSGIPANMMRKPESVIPRTRVRCFLCVARLVPSKRVDAVIRAFGALPYDDLALTIIGDGVERVSLLRLAAEQRNAAAISFLNDLTRKEVLAQMENADCFALVSERETFGMVYIEAMSTGAIPIGSTDEGASDFVRPGENGFLVPAGDCDALRARMEALIQMDEDQIAALSRAAADTTSGLRDDLLAGQAIEILQGYAQNAR